MIFLDLESFSLSLPLNQRRSKTRTSCGSPVKKYLAAILLEKTPGPVSSATQRDVLNYVKRHHVALRPLNVPSSFANGISHDSTRTCHMHAEA